MTDEEREKFERDLAEARRAIVEMQRLAERIRSAAENALRILNERESTA